MTTVIIAVAWALVPATSFIIRWHRQHRLFAELCKEVTPALEWGNIDGAPRLLFVSDVVPLFSFEN